MMAEMWNILNRHANRLNIVSLRELCSDQARFSACSVEFDCVLFDYSKEKIDSQAMLE